MHVFSFLFSAQALLIDFKVNENGKEHAIDDEVYQEIELLKRHGQNALNYLNDNPPGAKVVECARIQHGFEWDGQGWVLQ